jgi:hypothetical protein
MGKAVSITAGGFLMSNADIADAIKQAKRLCGLFRPPNSWHVVVLCWIYLL